MELHTKIETVMSSQARSAAIGDINEFPHDAMVTYMSRYAEHIFEPKRILSDEDWLKSNREPDQRFDYYKHGNGNIKWLSPEKNCIYLFIADDNSFTNE